MEYVAPLFTDGRGMVGGGGEDAAAWSLGL